MEKRGSRYLRFALINAAKYACHWDETFGAYLQKKISEGKHYNVAITHAGKKLVRLIYAMEKFRNPYIKTSQLFLPYNTLFEHRYTMLCLSCDFQGTTISEMRFRNSFINFHLRLDF